MWKELLRIQNTDDSARTGEGPADPLTYLDIAIGIRGMTARDCERRR